MHEREKKLGAHHARLGENLQEHSSTHYRTQPLDAAPCAVFEFRYRPKAILQAQGIVDAEPSAHSIEQSKPKKRKADSQALDVPKDPLEQALPSKKPKVEAQAGGSREGYVRSLEKRVRALEAQLPDPAAEVKVEENSSHVPFPFKKGEVIDLTIDDD